MSNIYYHLLSKTIHASIGFGNYSFFGFVFFANGGFEFDRDFLELVFLDKVNSC